MKTYLDMMRNSPDFIMERDGAKMQDPRFVLIRDIPVWRYVWIKIVVHLYDSCKDWIRKQTDLEAGYGLNLPRRELFWKKYWLKKGKT